jgi:hypothetical protein
MTSMPSIDPEELVRRISRDLADSYDEELEMEIEDRHPRGNGDSGTEAATDMHERQRYFSQLSDCRRSSSSCRTGWLRPAQKS